MKKKIIWTFILILLTWMSNCGMNISALSNAGYDYDTATSLAIYYTTIGTLILTLIMITVPAICAIINKGKMEHQKRNKIVQME